MNIKMNIKVYLTYNIIFRSIKISIKSLYQTFKAKLTKNMEKCKAAF